MNMNNRVDVGRTQLSDWKEKSEGVFLYVS